MPAHCTAGEFQWLLNNGNPEHVPHSLLTDRLASIPAVAANPANTTFIMLGCCLGTIFDDGVIPSALRGMHVITSSPDSTTLSRSNAFSRWIVHALGSATDGAGLISSTGASARTSTGRAVNIGCNS